jgi:prepilin peptidase CpaA
MALILPMILTCLMLMVMISDFTRFIIPNWLVVVLLALYPVMVLLAPVKPDWMMAILIGSAAFGVGFVLFILKVMGGGDVKLLAVAGVWAGTTSFLPLIFGVGVWGGILAVLLLIIRPIIAFGFSKLKSPPSIIRVFTIGEPVPYGVAIALSFLILLWTGKISGLVF